VLRDIADVELPNFVGKVAPTDHDAPPAVHKATATAAVAADGSAGVPVRSEGVS
jgi:hypothetical protein